MKQSAPAEHPVRPNNDPWIPCYGCEHEWNPSEEMAVQHAGHSVPPHPPHTPHTSTHNVPAALGATLFSIRGILGDFSELPRRQMKLARIVATEWPL